MATATREVMATRTTVFKAEEFDLKAVKKMMCLNYEESKNLIFSWPIVYDLKESSGATEGTKKWRSDLFPTKDNEGFGQLSLSYCNNTSSWTPILRTQRFDSDRAKSINFYFMCKYRFQGDTQRHTVTGFGAITSTQGNEAQMLWSHPYDASTLMPSILLEIYQFPTEVPKCTFSVIRSVVVGKIENFNRGRNAKGQVETTARNPRFNSASLEPPHFHASVTVSFFNDESSDGNCSGLSATLHITNNNRESCAHPVPFIATFTIFSEKDETNDFVKKIVLCREKSDFEHSLLLAWYADIEPLVENDTLYFKKVCDFFVYKARYADSKVEIPNFEIDVEIALELFMAANFLDC